MTQSIPAPRNLTNEVNIRSATVWSRWRRFALSTLTIGLMWMVVLPWIGRLAPVAEHIRIQQELGIDPSALFYSELEIAPGIAHRIERLQETHTMSWNKRVANSTPEVSQTSSTTRGQN